MSSPTFAQKLTAEAIGTAILVFIGAGSVPLTVFLTGDNPFGSAELSTISFAFAFAIFAAVYSVGHISGCHINPAVTIALLATRKIDSTTAIGYIAAQLAGAFIGAGLTLIILTGNDPATLGLGAVAVNANAGLGIGFAAEVIGTAILVFTVFGAAVDGRAPGGLRRDHHRLHRVRDHHPGRPDHGRGAEPGPPDRPGDPRAGHRLRDANLDALLPVYIAGPIVGGLVGAFAYQFIGHTRTATVPASAVAEHAHEAA